MTNRRFIYWLLNRAGLLFFAVLSWYVINSQYAMAYYEIHLHHKHVYDHYLNNSFNYETGISSGWLTRTDNMRPYIDLTWKVPVSSIIDIGIKSIVLLNQTYEMDDDKSLSSEDLYKITPHNTISSSEYLDLSIMPWMRLSLAPNLNYTVGVVVPNLVSSTVSNTNYEGIKGGIINVLTFDLSGYKAYVGGLYDFEYNQAFSTLGLNYMTKNLNVQKTYDPNAHFLTNATLRFGVNPSLLANFRYDHDTEDWISGYSVDLKVYLAIENHALYIAPGINLNYNMHSASSFNIGFFIDLMIFRY